MQVIRRCLAIPPKSDFQENAPDTRIRRCAAFCRQVLSTARVSVKQDALFARRVERWERYHTARTVLTAKSTWTDSLACS
jgi:hypothetical protein